MKVRLLPSSAGRESQYQSLTSFIVDDRLAIDGGSLGFALTPEQIGSIHDVIITHAHSDHTASLPIYVAEAFPRLQTPINIYATAEVVSALRQFVFNDHVWPNFENIPLDNGTGPGLVFHELKLREKVKIAGFDVTPIPVNHIVPTVGLLLQNEAAAVVFSSDTYTTNELWEVAKQVEDLKAVFVDVSYPNERRALAEASKHLTPELLSSELEKLDRDVKVYAVHIKPTNRDDVIKELSALGDARVSVGEIGHAYEW